MQASETKLQKIIEGTQQYVVPLFQRTYSWEKKQWQALWNDIIELYEADNPRTHFMGSIVTIPTTSLPEGISKYLLIDGQQRLTTIFILLSALRDAAKHSEERLAAEINDKFLVNSYEEGLDYYKLQPTQIDRTAFHQIINSENQVKESGILECYRFFQKIIQREAKLELQRIKKLICSNFSLVSVVLNADDDPHLVFESLNAKGRPLTQADLIRNYFFMRIHTDSQESVYAQYWQPMQELLGKNLTDFIRHYLNKNGIEVKENEIYFAIKDRISDNSNALSYLEDLYVFSEYYSKILNPNLESKEILRKYLHRLNRLDVATVYPFLLNCYDDCMKNRITEQEFVCVLQVIENFILRRFVCNIQTRGLNRIFALLYSQVSKGSDLAADNFIDRLKLTLQKRDYPKDAEFSSKLVDVKLYGSNRTEKGNLILESIEEHFKHKEQVSFDQLSIEHIMPQTLNDWWKKHLGEDWSVTHELFQHTLGNLTLTAYNAELSNATFERKKEEFKNSHLELNKYFESKKSWSREDIEKRGEELTKIALQIWSYFGDPSVQPLPKIVRLTGTTPKRLDFCGQEYPVESWRDVMQYTLNQIADLDPDNFKEIMEKFPRFIGWDKKDFRETRTLDNGAFIEVHLNSKEIYTFCMKAIETAELSEEWQVKDKDNRRIIK